MSELSATQNVDPRTVSLSQTRQQRHMIRMDQLQPRQCAVVAQVVAEVDELDRLKAMGVCVGRKVELVKRGDPLILRVLGSRLGLSARLARCVEVEPCDQPQCQIPAQGIDPQR